MNFKTIAMGLIVFGAIFAAGRWTWQIASRRPADPLGVRLTLDYDGDVAGLFKALEAKSGAHYDLDPKVSKRMLNISVKDASVTTIQEKAAKQSGLRYRPLDLSGRMIKVESK